MSEINLTFDSRLCRLWLIVDVMQHHLAFAFAVGVRRLWEAE
jgi:hypothetical protein